MKILAIECSHLAGGVALADDDRILAFENWSEQSRHGELVVPAIDRVIRASGLAPSALDLIAVDIGPGRFTGVRVGINAARALSYSLDCPVAAFDSLTILAEGCTVAAGPLVTLINAHKNMVYTATFEPSGTHGWTATSAPRALTLPELEQAITKPMTCVGDGFETYKAHFSSRLKANLLRNANFADQPSVEVLARLAKSARPMSWRQINPLYIRASEAEEKLKAGLITGL